MWVSHQCKAFGHHRGICHGVFRKNPRCAPCRIAQTFSRVQWRVWHHSSSVRGIGCAFRRARFIVSVFDWAGLCVWNVLVCGDMWDGSARVKRLSNAVLPNLQRLLVLFGQHNVLLLLLGCPLLGDTHLRGIAEYGAWVVDCDTIWYFCFWSEETLNSQTPI